MNEPRQGGLSLRRLAVVAGTCTVAGIFAIALYHRPASVLLAHTSTGSNPYKSNGGKFNFLAYETALQSRETDAASAEAAVRARKDINAYFQQIHSLEGLVTELQKSGATCKTSAELKLLDSSAEEYCFVEYNEKAVCLSKWGIMIPMADALGNRDIDVIFHWTCL